MIFALEKIEGETIGGDTKLKAIREYLKAHNFSVDLAECYGYADSYSDAPMLSAVGHPVAAFPDAELQALALKKGWTILTANSH